MLKKTSLPSLSPHIRGLKASPTLAVNELSNKLIQQGGKVYRLGFGQSPFPVPKIVVEALRKHAAEKDYLPVAGLRELRSQIAKSTSKNLGIAISEEQIIIGPGSKELIFNLQMAFEGEILLPSPSWVSYAPQATIAGKSQRWIECTYENHWKLDPRDLEAACKERPDMAKLLILNYPSNPTGVSYEEDELKALSAVARKYDLLICADEIYGKIHYTGQHKSLVAYYPEGTIISSGLSKWCGAGGWRLGTFVFPKTYDCLQEAMLKIASETYSAVSAPIQYAAVQAYTDHPSIQQYLNHSRLILKWVADFVQKTLVEAGVQVHPAVGGFYVFPDFNAYAEPLHKQGIEGSRDFCKALLLETGVALLPGADFGRPEQELTARLSFVDFDGTAALQAIASGNYQKESFVQNLCPQIYEAIPAMTNWLKNTKRIT